MFYKLWDKECSKESAYVLVAESMVYSLKSTVNSQQSIVNSLWSTVNSLWSTVNSQLEHPIIDFFFVRSPLFWVFSGRE